MSGPQKPMTSARHQNEDESKVDPASKKRSRAEAGLLSMAQQYPKRRRGDEVTDMMEFLKRQTEKHWAPRKNKNGFKLAHWRAMTLSQMAMVIFLRYGSLTSDRELWHNYNQVFKKTGVKPSTQWFIIKRWRERGFKVESHHLNKGRGCLLKDDQMRFLSNPRTLRDWSHLSLEARAAVVREKFNLPSFSG